MTELDEAARKDKFDNLSIQKEEKMVMIVKKFGVNKNNPTKLNFDSYSLARPK